MAHIVVNIQPFTIEQMICVYCDGECVEITKAPIDKIVDTVKGKITTYDVNRVDLCGSPDFLTRYADAIKNTNLEKYNSQMLDVNIVTRR